MKIIIFMCFISIKFIYSENIVCDEPVDGNITVINNELIPEDIINISILGIVDNLNLKYIAALTYKFNKTDILTTRMENIEDYMKENIQSIDFQFGYNENSTQKVFDCHYNISSNGSIKNVFQIPNLKYFSSYVTSVGYTFKNGKVIRNKVFDIFETCFGEPEKPVIISKSIGSDCVLRLSWGKPSVINAPSICYYDVKIDKINETFSVNELSFTNGNMKPNTTYKINVQSINDEKCYKTDYPQVDKCTNKKLGSSNNEIFDLIVENCDSSSITSPSPSPSPSSSSPSSVQTSSRSQITTSKGSINTKNYFLLMFLIVASYLF